MANDQISANFRPPIVAFMGHIDHGKTSLLDKIRSTSVVAREAGGITQHVSCYQLSVTTSKNQKRTITFIDTPGHAAFCQMRTRGLAITDLVVLVVSGTEGVMAQTKECVSQLVKSEIPIIVAVNKVDLPDYRPEKVKGQLVEIGLTPEDYGGQIPLVEVSAKTGLGIEALLDQILLHADVMELKSEPNSPLEAFVVESRLDKSRGPVASLIIKKGTLHLGDNVFVKDQTVKVKSMVDSASRPLKEALPGFPLEVLGFSSPPPVGSLITGQKQPAPATSVVAEKAPAPVPATPRLAVVIKADVQGTLEALLNSFTSDVEIISAQVGPVSDRDIFLAQAGQAQVFAFNTTIPKATLQLAKNQGVRIFQSKIIYEIIEDIQNQVLKLLEPTIDETVLGEGYIKAEFEINKQRIAGVQCLKGEISKGASIHLKRDNQIIKDTKVDTIQQGKLSIDSVKAGKDCGLTFKPYVDFHLNDVIIAYKK